MRLKLGSLLPPRHKEVGLDGFMPVPPNDDEKWHYLKRRLLWIYPFSALSIGCLAVSFWQFSTQTPELFPFLIILIGLVLTWVIGVALNLGTVDFSRVRHERIVAKVHDWWSQNPQDVPSIDICLPIAGESIAVLDNTWKHIKELVWPGVLNVYVLDDGKSSEAEQLANHYGFHYLSRPDEPNEEYPHLKRGYLQKAGNMLFGFERSNGDLIAVFDADFVARPEYLLEAAAYTVHDEKIAIVQTPQYFRADRKKMYRLERAAASVQEWFYRVSQTSRNKHNAAICVGTCAIYRRTALAENTQYKVGDDGRVIVNAPCGGPTQIGHSEDVHTGFSMRERGWGIKYVPVIYNMGICPSVVEAFLAQQYRWCMGSMSLVRSARFWEHFKLMSFSGFLGYLSGFLYYWMTAAATIFGPLIPLILLLLLPGLIALENYLLIVPSVLYTLVILPLWHKHPYWFGAFAAKMTYGWAHLFAIWDMLRGKPKGWSPTNAVEVKTATSKKTRSTKEALGRSYQFGIVVWGGGTALLWITLSLMYCIFPPVPEHHWWDYAPMLALGLIYGVTVALAIQPGIPKRRVKKGEGASVKLEGAIA
jgi:cellulose synthase (UDP-forming)